MTRNSALCLVMGLLLGACFEPGTPELETTFGNPTTGPVPGTDSVDPDGDSTADDAATSVATSGDDSGSEVGGLECGNGMVDGDEQCDDGVESATCNSDCTMAACGDGQVNATAGEVCDDAGESAECDADCSAVECQDGIVNISAGENCEEGGETASCDADCTFVECGDGTLNVIAGEICDDGGESAMCDADCTVVECGDGLANMAAGEDCDELGETATCDADCTTPVCGDGVFNPMAGEDCDDGGVVPGDGCDELCLSELPMACDAGVDPMSGDPWVVCSADAGQAWVAHADPGGGNFHPELICAELGYSSVGQFGGTCGDVCGYCEAGTSCMSTGNQNYDGGGNCGMDAGGLVLCITVHWQCLA